MSSILSGITGQSASRRGTAIVLAVGTLVLLSVLTVIYWGIGRSDVRTSVVSAETATTDADMSEIGRYLAGVIGDDVLDFGVERGGDVTQNPIVFREGADYPGASWPVNAALTGDPTLWPKLSIPGVATSNQAEIDRLRFNPTGGLTISDRLNIDLIAMKPTDPWLAPHKPVALGPAGISNTGATLGGEWNQRAWDWASISNFAPDGRFVNLWGLRNNFDVPSWELTEGRRLGSRYTGVALLEADGSQTRTLDIASAGGTTADPNVPAHWTMRQRNMFRPLIDDTAFPNGTDFSDPGYRPYQFADVDRDGMIDSRWFELVDLSESTQITTPRDMIARALIDTPGEMRYFVAARAVDLSGLVNVNTATDLREAPTDVNRIGATPADVDLRRLLTMLDAVNYYYGSSGGYSQLLQPSPVQPQTADYSGYDLDLTSGGAAFDVGSRAYDVLRYYFQERRFPGTNEIPQRMTANLRRNHFENIGAAVPSRAVELNTSLSARGPQFGLPSLAELLTYRGVNDDVVLSPLEAATGGRFINNYGPLRDNRPLVVERQRTNVNNGAFIAGFAQAWNALDIRQLLTTFNVARPIRSERLRFQPTVDSFVKAVTELSAEYAPSEFNEETRVYLEDVLDSSQRLFDGYARALLPGWDPDMWTEREQWTRTYANDPFKAMLTAAQLMVNQRAIDDSATASIDSAIIEFQPGTATNVGQNTTVLSSDLFPPGAVTHPAAAIPGYVELYGVKAQPFITEVATFVVYADAEASSGSGDNGEDLLEVMGPPPNPQNTYRIFLDGDVRAGNDDYVMTCVAFQLHNPFDEDIKLWDSTGDQRYYIRFADHEFALGESTSGDNVSTASSISGVNAGEITLEPNQSIIVYALSQRLSAIEARIDALPNGDIMESELRDWLEDQFRRQTSGGGPGLSGTNSVSEKDPELILVRDENATGGFVDFFGGATSAEIDTITLWRIAGAQQSEHVLVDRFRVGGGSGHLDVTLSGRTETGETYVSGSIDPGTDPDGSSIMFYASARRPSRTASIKEHSLPAWCVEVKHGASRNWKSDSPNQSASMLFNNSAGDTRVERGPSAKLMFTSQLNASRDPFSEALDSGTRLSTSWPAFGTSSHEQITIELPKYASPGFGTSSASRTRVADLMLPLAIGPRRDGLSFGGAGGAPADDPAWTTFGEMVALALGYDNAGDPSKLLDRVDEDTDRGYLRLADDSNSAGTLSLTSFYDNNGDGIFNSGDFTIGPGIPVAYNIIDVFTAMSDEYASRSRGVPGLINVNTAPLEVLRTLPMLSPPPSTGAAQEWWGALDPSTPVGGENDIAASLYAYAHRAVIPTRRAPLGSGERYVSFGTNLGGGGDTSLDPDPRNVGRGFLNSSRPGSGLRGLREDSGIASIGELLAVRFADPLLDIHSIDAIGRDGRPLDEVGVDSIRRTQGGIGGGGGAQGDEVDGLIDEHDERLAIVNAIADIATVRSDAFAVWFEVHGYAREDVEGLTPQDPLVPSVARRFLMIIDRSNVVRLGDEPQILLFRELPL